MYKKFVLLSEKKISKTLSSCQKKTTGINVLIFNKLVDFQNCFLTFSTFKLFTNIKRLSKSQFETVPFLASRPRFWKLSVLFSFLCLTFLQRIQTGCKYCIRTFWLLFSENRKWICYETKLRGRPFNSWGGWVWGWLTLKKKIPASACRKKKIACSTNVIERLWEKREKNILPTR